MPLQPDIADDWYLHLTFPSDVRASLHTSWLWPERRRVLAAIGSKGMLVYNEADQKVILFDKTVGQDLSHRGRRLGGRPLKVTLSLSPWRWSIFSTAAGPVGSPSQMRRAP